MYKPLLILTLLIIAAACGTVERGTIPWEEPTDENITENQPDARVSSNTNNNSAKTSEFREYLQLAYQDWKGIPYVLGGTDYNGIDCSAFMQVVFEDYLMHIIPRTTSEQLQTGQPISRKEVKTADLVFFKTGRRTFHVGVMINEREFLHASTTEGVKISYLNHSYWQERYFTSRRIF